MQIPCKRTEDGVLKSDFVPSKITGLSKQMEKSQMTLSKDETYSRILKLLLQLSYFSIKV